MRPDGAELAADLRSWAAEKRESLVSALARLASIDAPTGDVEALRVSEELVASRLAELGGKVRRHPTPAGTHLEASFGPADGKPVLIIAHYDTVWPRGTAAARPPRVENGVIHGPGVFDMRGGLVAALGAVEALATLGELRRPLRFLVTADEESGSVTSEELVVALGRAAGSVLIPEPPLPGGALKTARKGVIAYRLDVEGREAHAGGAIERGTSAIHELMELCSTVRGLARPAAGTTANVGLIGGGTRPNVVAGAAFAEVDVRVASAAEQERVEAAFAALRPSRQEASLTVTRLHVRPPMERTAAIAKAAARARELASLLGAELQEGATGGGSDGNFLAPLGVAVLDGLGPEGGGAHALDEHVLVRSLEERAVLLALLVALLEH